MELRFTIAKKINRPAQKAKGTGLSTLRAEEGSPASMIITSSEGRAGFDRIRESVYGLPAAGESAVHGRLRGSSYELYGALPALAEFAKGISFNSEDAKDAAEFIALMCGGGFPEMKITSVKLEKSSMEVGILYSSDAETSAEEVYAALSGVCEKYGLGIIKQPEAQEPASAEFQDH